LAKVSFSARQTPFYDELRKEAEAYFQKNKISRTGDYRLYLKTFILLSSLVFSYVTLVWYTPIAWVAILLSGFMGFVLALIGFNVMHDSCHGSYSSKKWVNQLMGYSMNLLGSNQFIWKMKHNVIHHTYTNVDGVDDDIIKVPVLRHCKSQPYKKIHRYQHVYGFVLYAVSTILWVFLTDMVKYFKMDISGTAIKKFPLQEHIIYWVTKVLYVVIYIAVPVYFLGFSTFIVGYLVMNAIFGLTMSIVFQLAHAVEITEFDDATHANLLIEKEWAEFQINTTADFAPKSQLANWLCGGLNFQVIHHLFPFVSHVHYQSLQPIVEKVCKKYNIHYNVFPTFGTALASHVNYLKVLGEKE
jgi:linoleoyl-CoA desaturase